jgi:pimeloyl-ACP methyl ester carboxylesterase
MTRRRLLPRVMFLVAVLALFGLGAYLAWLQSWRASQMLDLAARSEIVTLPIGEMEFALRGSGEPVLIFHSAPGGYDQALALGGFLEDAGFQILAPSRPGYLRTPLSTGASPVNQAQAISQLLDHMQIKKVGVIGFGWGASAAIEFAKLFPDRASALLLVSPATSETPLAPGIPLPQAIADKMGSDAGSLAFLKKAESNPSEALRAAFDLTSSGGPKDSSTWVDFILQDPAKSERFQEILLSLAPLSARKSGLENDLVQPLASLRGLKTPTLVIQGGADKAVSPASDRARFAPAELFSLPKQGHLILLGQAAPEAAKRMVDFLNLHPVGGTQKESPDAE